MSHSEYECLYIYLEHGTQEGEACLQEYGRVSISSWIYVALKLKTEQVIQGEIWKVFVLSIWL